MTHQVRRKDGYIFRPLQLEKEKPLFIDAPLVDIGDKFPFFGDFVATLGGTSSSDELRMTTQISLIGLFVPHGGDLSLLRTLWTRFGVFTSHQVFFSDFAWSVDNLTVSIALASRSGRTFLLISSLKIKLVIRNFSTTSSSAVLKISPRWSPQKGTTRWSVQAVKGFVTWPSDSGGKMSSKEWSYVDIPLLQHIRETFLAQFPVCCPSSPQGLIWWTCPAVPRRITNSWFKWPIQVFHPIPLQVRGPVAATSHASKVRESFLGRSTSFPNSSV